MFLILPIPPLSPGNPPYLSFYPITQSTRRTLHVPNDATEPKALTCQGILQARPDAAILHFLHQRVTQVVCLPDPLL